METDNIQGGAFQIARKLFESDLWENKPSSWKVIWIYILGNVNHKENEHFERGEGFFNFSKDLRKIGNDISEDMVKKFCSYARQNEMISTERSTRGMRIKVLNYNTYQTMGNYIRTSIGTSLARDKHETSTPINKNEKNEKNSSDSLRARGYEVVSSSPEESEKPKKAVILSDKEYKSVCDLFSLDCFALYRKDKTQRTDVKTMLEEKGFEQIELLVRFAQAHKDEQYFPQARTPHELLGNWIKLAEKIEAYAD